MASKTPTPATNTAAPKPTPKGKFGALIALVGTGAAAMLLVDIPRDESGRVTEAVVTEDNLIELTHVSGREYRRAYVDVVGVLTICDGDTHNVRRGQVATREECEDRLERQLIAHAKPVLECVPALRHPARKNQLVASVSLAYNIGPGRFCRSSTARNFRAGEWVRGCHNMKLWNKGRINGRINGRLVPIRGLTNRRARESKLCLEGL